MHTTISRNRVSTILTHTAAITFFAAAATLGLNAQQSAGTALTLPSINLNSSLIAPLDLSSSSSSSSSSDDLNYTSDTGAQETATAESYNFLGSDDQPPPRRRYGRPNYNDSRTNPDGSNKYTFMGGVGFTMPTGGTHNYLSPNWKIQLGGGRNFNKTFGVLAQFDYDHFGFQTATLNNLLAIYNGDDVQADLPQLGGTSHVWSFTIDPIINYYTSDSFGAYVTGGAGFYHKTANFTTPETGEECDPYYGCYEEEANATVDKYTSNSVGVNAGFGFTYKLSRWAGERLYVEARYVWTDNQPRPFDISGTTSYFNAFPQNSARTTYIPVTFGMRF